MKPKSTYRTKVKLLGLLKSEEKESCLGPCFLQKVNFQKNQSLNGGKSESVQLSRKHKIIKIKGEALMKKVMHDTKPRRRA